MDHTDSVETYKGVVKAVEAWVAATGRFLAADKALKTYPKRVENPVITDAHGVVAWERYMEDREANIASLEAEVRQAERERASTFSDLFGAIPFYGVWFKTNLGYVRKIEGLPHLQFKSIDDILEEVQKNHKLPF